MKCTSKKMVIVKIIGIILITVILYNSIPLVKYNITKNPEIKDIVMYYGKRGSNYKFISKVNIPLMEYYRGKFIGNEKVILFINYEDNDGILLNYNTGQYKISLDLSVFIPRVEFEELKKTMLNNQINLEPENFAKLWIKNNNYYRVHFEENNILHNEGSYWKRHISNKDVEVDLVLKSDGVYFEISKRDDNTTDDDDITRVEVDLAEMKYFYLSDKNELIVVTENENIIYKAE